MELFNIILLIALSIISTNAIAKTYKCVDENGDIIYSQTACESDQKTDKVIGGNKRRVDAENCGFAERFAMKVTLSMRSGTGAQKTIERYGGINSLSKSTIGIINYIYSYADALDIPASKITALTVTKCKAKSFGDVTCEDFPDEFQVGVNSCDEEEREEALKQNKMRKRMNVQDRTGIKLENDNEEANKKEKKKSEKKRIEECKESYDLQLENIRISMRKNNSSSQRDRLKDEKKELQKKRYSECR